MREQTPMTDPIGQPSRWFVDLRLVDFATQKSVSVRSRILILVLCVVVCCMAATAWAVASTYARENAAMEQALRETARALSLVVDRELGRREAIAWTLAT